MKKLTIILAGLAFMFSTSCKKQNSDEIKRGAFPKEVNFPLKVGNYWVFDMNVRDTLDVITYQLVAKDTLKIIGTDSLFGKLFYKTKSNRFSGMFPELLREENNTIYGVYEDYDSGTNTWYDVEKIFFIEQDNFTSIWTDMPYSWTNTPLGRMQERIKTENGKQLLSLTSGNYIVRNTQYEIFNPQGFHSFYGNYRSGDRQFSKNIGPVRFTLFFIAGMGYNEFVLNSFHLN